MTRAGRDLRSMYRTLEGLPGRCWLMLLVGAGITDGITHEGKISVTISHISKLTLLKTRHLAHFR